MLSSLAERLSAVRQHQFVGRQCECAFFTSVLDATQLPFAVLHVFGPGGVGKTMLLWEFTQICQHLQTPFISLDARNIEPSPASFLSTLSQVIGLAATDDPLKALAQINSRQALLIDTYEMLSPLDDWLREEFLPQLSEQTLVVLAGRNAPTSVWQADPGWQALLYTLSLRNLCPDESRTYLTQRNIPIGQHQSIIRFTHGHPLALSLIADVFAQGREIDLPSLVTSDAIRALLNRFLEEAPSAEHRQALEACAIVRVMTEALLAIVLEISDAHRLFSWLCGLSFIESGQTGVFPHDLAREVLVADLRWRNPDRYAELHQRARAYYVNRLERTEGQEKHSVLFDYIFLHRDNPAIKPRFTWQEISSLQMDRLRESDIPDLLQMVSEHEGEVSARLLGHWLERQPEGVAVVRDVQQQPAGFVFMVALHRAAIEDLDADPAAIACWKYLQKHAPLRKNEGATLFRFWMDREAYQAVSPTQSVIFITLVQHYQNTPGLAFTFLPCADPDFWVEMFTYADLARLPEVDFEIGGRGYGVYGHDWRVVPPPAWQDLLARREVATSATAIQPAQGSDRILVLSQAEFIEAVQQALRHFTRPDALHNNPLLRSRFMAEQVSTEAGLTERVTTLQTLLKQVAESLQASPRDDKLYRALYRTYLNPAPTQERAAELLDLPFSTYRRHLKVGVMRLADILWQQEIR